LESGITGRTAAMKILSLPLFEIASVSVRFDLVASGIVNANYSIA
jgi:hypothetical protein